MSYTLQLPATVIDDAKMYASSCGTTLAQLLKMYVLELSTRKPSARKRKLGIAEGECRVPTMEEDRMMDEEIANLFESSADEVFEVIAKPPNTSHAKFAKYAKFRFMDDFANLADFA